MTEIVLIRPGCTDFDEQKRIQGELDLPLNSRGQEQVQQLVEQLHDIPLEAIYTSNSDPSKSTAEAIGEALAIPVKNKESLSNLNQGLWQGLLVEDVKRKYPKAYKQWLEIPESICPPEGETISEVWERVEKALQKPMKRHHVFGIIAPEPLATLIGCMIEKRAIEVPRSFCRVDEQPRIEILHPAVEQLADPQDENKPEGVEHAQSSDSAVPVVSSKMQGVRSSIRGDNS